jgi:hypothetical protein
LLLGVVRRFRHIGLALLFATFLGGESMAQVPTRDTLRTRADSARADSARGRVQGVAVPIPTPADSARADSVRARARADSIRADRLARRAADSIKVPLARSEMPTLVDIGERYQWSRDDLFSTGALTLGELLGRIPGVTGFASGWISTPQTASYVGDFRRIRVFYDGIELDPLDTRVGPLHDFASIPMWTLQELAVERAAEELRVYIRSWQVNKTTPVTRVDVATGDLSTNSYRGFFGRRFSNGTALQVGAQQFSTQDPKAGGDGDHLGLLGRFGWAKKQWSADAMFVRTRRSRTEQLREVTEEGGESIGANLPGVEATRTDAYARIGYGNIDSAYWLQLIAATSRFAETNEKTETTTTPTPGTPFVGDTVDTTAVRGQYIATAGTRVLGASVSATARLRLFRGLWFLTPSARASYERGALAVSAFAEQQVSDSTFRGDVSARFSPLSFLAVSGSLGRTSALDGADRAPSLAYRGEVGLRLGRLWATGGVMSVDTLEIPAPIAYDTLYQPAAIGAHRTTFATLRGPIWKAIGLNIIAHKSPAGLPYIPEYQVRSEIYASTWWLSRFPDRNFHILLSIAHDYRTQVDFPVAEGEPQRSSQYRVISTMLELRLYDAVISWQYRNVVGEIYNVIPGFTAPRAINYYGVRWDFFN